MIRRSRKDFFITVLVVYTDALENQVLKATYGTAILHRFLYIMRIHIL